MTGTNMALLDVLTELDVIEKEPQESTGKPIQSTKGDVRYLLPLRSEVVDDATLNKIKELSGAKKVEILPMYGRFDENKIALKFHLP